MPIQSTKFQEIAVKKLRENGFRITNTRLLVLACLENSERAMTANEIFESIRSMGYAIDHVSVYRILSTLTAMDLIHHIGVVDGYWACRMEHPEPHDTEHLVCTKCGNIIELSFAPEFSKLSKMRAATAGFAPENIKIEVQGTCSKCQSA